MKRSRRHRISPALLVLRENALPTVGFLVVLLLFGWYGAQRWDTRLARCLELYDRAHTAADTARVDMTSISARVRATCLDSRRDGSLDRYRQSIEAGRVPPRP